MTRLLSILFTFSLLLSSCRTCKVPEPILLHSSDSLRTEYRETLRIDTLRVKIPIPPQSASVMTRDTTSRLETSLAISTAEWREGLLFHSLIQKDTTLTASALAPRTDTSTSVIRDRSIPVPVPTPVYIPAELTPWQRWQIRGFWLLSAMTALLLYFKLRSKK